MNGLHRHNAALKTNPNQAPLANPRNRAVAMYLPTRGNRIDKSLRTRAFSTRDSDSSSLPCAIFCLLLIAPAYDDMHDAKQLPLPRPAMSVMTQ